MGKKSRRQRGVDAPRPLGFGSDSPQKLQDILDLKARERSVEQEERARLERALYEGGQMDIVLDYAIEGACDGAELDGTGVPTVSRDELARILDAAPEHFCPSTEAVWMCARNDFSGKALELLLRRAGGIHRCNEWHNINHSTPISVCCSRGNVEGLKTMIQVAREVGFELDAGKKETQGAEPLSYAVQSRGNNMAVGSIADFCEIIKLLVTQLGRDIECIEITSTRPPGTGLARACELGERMLVETCLELGADVNRPSLHNNGMTPLHFAAKCGSASIAQLLLDRGADTRATMKGYYLPIRYCLESMNFAVADLILRHEAELKLAPLTAELDLYNNMPIILEAVETFRKTGDRTGPGIRIFDARQDTIARDYAEQARAKTMSKGHKSVNQCDACGAYGAAMKACTGCLAVKYCGKTCQRKHWKVHKADCKIMTDQT